MDDYTLLLLREHTQREYIKLVKQLRALAKAKAIAKQDALWKKQGLV